MINEFKVYTIQYSKLNRMKITKEKYCDQAQ